MKEDSRTLLYIQDEIAESKEEVSSGANIMPMLVLPMAGPKREAMITTKANRECVLAKL